MNFDIFDKTSDEQVTKSENSDLDQLYALYQVHQRGGSVKLERNEIKNLVKIHQRAKYRHMLESKYPLDLDIGKCPTIGAFYQYVKKYIKTY